jgi:hypothetical protein
MITQQAHSDAFDDLVITDSQPPANSLNVFYNYFLIKTIKVYYENNSRVVFLVTTNDIIIM